MILKSKKFKALVAGLVVMTSMVGCSAVGGEKKEALTELTITHVTSPLNVPSIIQKNNNKVFELRFILYLCAMI